MFLKTPKLCHSFTSIPFTQLLVSFAYPKFTAPTLRITHHLKARELNVKLMNGLSDSNKGYDKDYLRVSGEWFTDGYPG
jgi:hypothetical protein